jgi:hypothetical protein
VNVTGMGQIYFQKNQKQNLKGEGDVKPVTSLKPLSLKFTKKPAKKIK